MKKWIYLILPAAMLGIFLVVYFSHAKKIEEREVARAEKVRVEQAESTRKKQEAESKAAKDAKERQREREEADAKKDADRLAKQAAIDKEVRDATNAFLADADKASKEASRLESDLASLHKSKDKTNRETFEMAKQVELARVAKRNAELEIQRMTEMISKRASDSSMTRMPPPPPPPPTQPANAQKAPAAKRR